MNIPQEYADHAYRKALLGFVQEKLRELLTGDATQPTTVVAEHLPYLERLVPQHQVEKLLREFETDIEEESTHLAAFTLERK